MPQILHDNLIPIAHTEVVTFMPGDATLATQLLALLLPITSSRHRKCGSEGT